MTDRSQSSLRIHRLWHRLQAVLGLTKAMSGPAAVASVQPADENAVIDWLFVGLGNPGKKYEATRHNVGFLVLDGLARQFGVTFAPQLKWNALVARADACMLVKPLTFMNESGKAVRALADFYKIPPEHCVVVYDDVALPFGQLRIRRSGSAGGHNGMKSIIACLHSQQFPRVRFGIGAAESAPLTSHVLGRFAPAESIELPVLVEHAVEAVKTVQVRGIDAAMAEWNGSGRTRGQ